ncbi:ABC transporter permease subunit [Brachybacterium sp. JHP9]|uniref:ABC transporter permease subunit n=2 Tax=Brachybacterium equifaecis TaxID=2910770 RepID=A0ABT0R047_9MICO|nr:ABC transporter permease subunit [Brachybacterium equifaecis]
MIERRKVPLGTRLRRDWPLLAMVSPAVVLMIVFAYIPMAGNIIAFQSYSPYAAPGQSPLMAIVRSPFVGLWNFQRVLTAPDFWNAVGNTLMITAFQLVLFFPVPIMIALLLNSVLAPGVRTAIQSIVYLPHFFSWVLVVTIFQQILGGAGLLNRLLRQAGLISPDGGGLDIMTNPDTFLLLVTSQAVWKDAGWGMIIFLAALSTVNPELYEAAAIDGANRWRRIWHITLPALRPTIILLLILRLGDSLTVGFEQLILQRDAVGQGAAEVLDTFVYYQGIQGGDFSYGAAAGLIKGVVSLLLVLGANRLAHAFGEAGVYQKEAR